MQRWCLAHTCLQPDPALVGGDAAVTARATHCASRETYQNILEPACLAARCEATNESMWEMTWIDEPGVELCKLLTHGDGKHVVFVWIGAIRYMQHK